MDHEPQQKPLPQQPFKGCRRSVGKGGPEVRKTSRDLGKNDRRLLVIETGLENYVEIWRQKKS